MVQDHCMHSELLTVVVGLGLISMSEIDVVLQVVDFE